MATAGASSLSLGVAVAPAASASAPPMLFGIGDHWEPDVQHDDAQLGTVARFLEDVRRIVRDHGRRLSPRNGP